MTTPKTAQVVAITGASAGVGRAVAHAFAKRGAQIGLLAREPGALEDARREVESLGGRAIAVPTDVADFAQVEAAAEAIEAEFGPIDVWVNDAMATIFARFVDIEPDEFQRATEVTYLGAVHGTMAALKRMVPRDRGAIVQVGSALAYRAIPLQSAYCGAKFAMRGFTDSVRTELLHDGSQVWITMVQLPAVNTPQFSWCRTKLPNQPQPVPPIFQPEVAAEAVYWAAHQHRREVARRIQRRQGDRGQQDRSALRRLVSRSHRIQVAADRGHARRPPPRKSLRARAQGGDPRDLRRARAAAELPVLGDLPSTVARRNGGSTRRSDRRQDAHDPRMNQAWERLAPHVLREYALIADGERGILVGPRGDFSWMCFPRWHDDAVFSSLVGGAGGYWVTPLDRCVWGGYYEPGSLIWRSRWITDRATVECREALALPSRTDRAVLLRRIVAKEGVARLEVGLDLRGTFGATPAKGLARDDGGTWSGRVGELRFRWFGGASAKPKADAGGGKALTMQLELEPGSEHDLVLVLALEERELDVPLPDATWSRTEQCWHERIPALEHIAARRDARHACVVLSGLTSSAGGMVAAATTSLPERAREGRSYDYRYAWIRDQCYAGRAGANAGCHALLDDAVRFVSGRLLEDGASLRPVYTVSGDPVPDERELDLPGYPGGDLVVGNHAHRQFQLDSFGEALLLLAAAAEHERLDDDEPACRRDRSGGNRGALARARRGYLGDRAGRMDAQPADLRRRASRDRPFGTRERAVRTPRRPGRPHHRTHRSERTPPERSLAALSRRSTRRRGSSPGCDSRRNLRPTTRARSPPCRQSWTI